MRDPLWKVRSCLWGSGIAHNVLGTRHGRECLVMTRALSFGCAAGSTCTRTSARRTCARVIADRDFNVDVADYDERRASLFDHEYDLVLDLHPVSARYRERLRRDAVALSYMTGSNPAPLERGRAFASRRCAPERLAWDMTVNHPATWTRRSLFERLGGFDPAWPNAMDYACFLRLPVAGCRFTVIERPLASMIAGGQSGRSLWTTLKETHRIRRRHLRRGLGRSPLNLAALHIRGGSCGARFSGSGSVASSSGFGEDSL